MDEEQMGQVGGSPVGGMPAGDAPMGSGMPPQPMVPPQEPTSSFAPPPASPGGAMGLDEASSGGFIGPEHLRQLDALAEKVRSKLGETQAAKFAGANSVTSKKSELIRSFLLKLQDAGVDITDQQAVADYVDSLREMYPDLADLFEEFVEGLLGTEADIDGLSEDEFAPMPGKEGEEGEAAEGPMKYENLSKNVRERIQE